MTNSFITLDRAGAQASRFEIGGIGTDDPFAATRQLAYANGDGTSAGRAALEGDRDVARFPHWEMMVVIGGTLTFDFDDRRVTAGANDALIVQRGARLRIAAQQPANWAFCAVSPGADAVPEGPAVTLLNRRAELLRSPQPDSALVTTTVPVACRAHVFFNRPDIGFNAGMWDATPYARKSAPHKTHELMHITRGRTELTDDEGRSEIYSAGDTLFVPRGTRIAWNGIQHVTKIYCNRVPAAL